MRVLLTGATGFVGRHMVKRLLQSGHHVHALVRPTQQRASSVFGLENSDWQERLTIQTGDVVSGNGLDAAMQGCEAVIHLVGIIMEKGSNSFQSVHHLGTRNVVEAARQAGIKRFIQMSALGVRSDGVAEYQTSKWRGEEEVRRSGIPYCILQPSLIFGPGDGFVTEMMETMRKAPLVRPVPGNGSPRFRPVFIDDVTFCFERALTSAAATDQTIELGGRDELTLNEVLTEIAQCAGIRKPPLHLPMLLMFLGAAIAEKMLSNPPVTVDQLKMLKEGSTCDIAPMKRIFGIEPRGFEGCGR